MSIILRKRKMNENWVCVDEDNTSSNSSYSDKVDSEIEAELYSIIHHQETIPNGTYSKLNNNENISSISTNHCNENVTTSCNENDCNIEFNQSDSSSNNTMNQPNIPLGSEEVECENSQKLFSLQKRKSNFESFLSVTSSKKESLNSSTLCINKDLNGETREYSHRKKKFLKKIKSNDYSTDSDSSVIWSEPNTPKANFKTNLLDTLSLSSDSMDSLIILSPSKRKMLVHNDSSAYRSTPKRTFEDLWSINDEDLYRRKNAKRYHSFLDHCSLCNQKGHLAKSCPVSKGTRCYICAGSHTIYECRNKACSKCYETGHDFRNCRRTLISYCFHCRMKGHDKKNCPDIWRRYHLTTKSKKIVQGRELKQSRRIYCFNCGWPDHFGSICREPRSFRGSPYPTWPSVISYSNPNYLLKERAAYIPNTPNTSVMKNELSKELLPQNVSQNASPLGETTPEQNVKSIQEATPTQNGTFKMSDFVAERRKQLKIFKKKAKNLQNTHTNNKELLISPEKNSKVRYRNFPRTPKRNRNVNNDISHSIIKSEISPFPISNNERSPISLISEDDPLPEAAQFHLLWQQKVQQRRIKRKMRKKANKAKKWEAMQHGSKV